MDLPEPLRAQPPRDLRDADALFAKNRSGLRAIAVSLVLLPAALLFGGWVLPRMTGVEIVGLDETSSVWISVGLDLLIGLFGLAMFAQLRRAQGLFCEGTAVVGQVVSVQASGAGDGSAQFVNVEVRFDASGQAYLGRASTTSHRLSAREGEAIPLLFLAHDPSKFALYEPELGMVPGVARPAET